MRSFSFRNKELSLRKELRASLIDIYGLSWSKAILITSKAGIAFPFFSCNLNVYYFGLISYLLHYLVISQTRISRFVQLNIKSLIDTHSYKGARHRLFLPVRGQRTRSNAQTRKKTRFN